MEYEVRTMNILNQLGISKTYKGYSYIVSSICFIHENRTTFLPITKILYVEIAKQYNTSDKCVEKDIRKVIERVWIQDKNRNMIYEIFGKDNVSSRPTNAEFLALLYKYIEYHTNIEHIFQLHKDKYTFTCPLSGNLCEFCNDFVYNIINKIYT